jgi:hypothetical protein
MNSKLKLSPPLQEYEKLLNKKIKIGIDGDHQKINTTLAISLCNQWLFQKNIKNIKNINLHNDIYNYIDNCVDNDICNNNIGDDICNNNIGDDICNNICDDLNINNKKFSMDKPFLLSNKYINGIKNCFWECRCQKIIKGDRQYFLDGAHTIESLNFSVKWFKQNSEKKNKKIKKVLIFYYTG